MEFSEAMFYTGLMIAGITVIAGIVAAIRLHRSKKQLQQQLEQEYGKQ